MSKKPTKSKEGVPSLQSPFSSENKDAPVSVPSALGAEKSVLSLMLKDPENYVGKAIEAGVREEFFYYSGHKIIWNLLQSRNDKKLPTDVTSVNQALMDSGDIDNVGGIGGLAELYSYDSLGAYFDHHLELLREKHILRSIIAICNESVTKAYSGEDEVAELLDGVEQSVLSIRESNEKKKAITFKKTLLEAADNIEQYMATGGTLQGVPSGYSILDDKSNGLKGGDMFVIAARPSMGKTSFLLNILEYITLEKNLPAMMFSCEMPSIQLAERLLYARSGLSKTHLVKNGLNADDVLKFNKAIMEWKDAPLILDDTPSISISELRAKARRAKREKDIAVIGIDYLQLMRSHTKQAQNSREREIAEISSGLKALAKELNIPVVVLAQLNRGPETRVGAAQGVPRMSDLRESGAIEQDADMIGLLYRTSYYNRDEKEKESEEPQPPTPSPSGNKLIIPGEAFLDLAKNRNGPTGKVPLLFYSELMKFAQNDAYRESE